MTDSTSNGKMKYYRTATIHRDRYYFLYLEIWMRVSVPVQIKSSTRNNPNKNKTARIRAQRRCQIWQIKTMTPEEKALLQAKHRLEAAQARDRRKERNARTRRLILEGAELEYVVPEVREMSREELRHFLSFHLQKHD